MSSWHRKLRRALGEISYANIVIGVAIAMVVGALTLGWPA